MRTGRLDPLKTGATYGGNAIEWEFVLNRNSGYYTKYARACTYAAPVFKGSRSPVHRCLHTCLHACLRTCLHTRLHMSALMSVHVSPRMSMRTCVCTYGRHTIQWEFVPNRNSEYCTKYARAYTAHTSTHSRTHRRTRTCLCAWACAPMHGANVCYGILVMAY